jgi:hypothetical protein
MTRTLRGMKFISVLPMPEGVFSGLFEDENDSNRKIIAIWSSVEDKSVEIEITSGKATLINTIGETADMKVFTRETKKFINVPLKKRSPAYIKLL